MLEEIREEKIRKLNNFKEKGIDPYPAESFEKEDFSTVVLKDEGEKARVAGRIMLMRNMGNIAFLHLQDESGRMQIVLNKKELEEDYKFWTKNLDIGDFLGAAGERFDTQKGEKSVLAKNLTLLSKSVLPLPDKHKSLQEEDDRLRKRYLDLLMNEELREIFMKKARFWEVARDFMKEQGFLEVETPTLEVTTGGAEAAPFSTHHNDFDLDVFLRISVGELWQKRLMAAGFEKTFEIGRVYRNEGSSPNHLQEFTNMEFYWAYADYKKGMDLVKELYRKIANEVFSATKFKTREYEYDLADDWKEIDYQKEIKRQTGVDILKTSEEEIKEKLEELGVKYEGENRERLTDTLWKYCRKNIAGPAFLINHPKLVSPLAKEKKDQPGLTERFQIIIAGAEVGNGYSELNNPIDQRERFDVQRELIERGDDEAMMPDEEFVEMLEYGMPPTCGFGFGERLFWFLVNMTGREATLFPLMKPKEEDKVSKDKKEEKQ